MTVRHLRIGPLLQYFFSSCVSDRNKKEIQESIAKLDRRDALRIKDLCKNYNKLQKYSKLITLDGNQQKFKVALENDIGKKSSDHQLHHAANSIRKAKLYIENVWMANLYHMALTGLITLN